MNSNRMLIGLGVAFVAAFILATVVYKEFKAVSAPTVLLPTHVIVVASEDLPLGTRLDTSNVKTIPWPDNQPIDGVMTKVEDTTGRAVITNVVANEPILETKLAPVASGAGLPATIPDGMRAVSVSVNDVVGVAGFVIPGTTVDVLATSTAAGPEGIVTRTILEDVRVLAAGQKTETDPNGKPETVPVVTLLVSPTDAGKLTMASQEGKIQLALRNTADTKITSPAPVLQATLFGGITPPAPAHVARAPRPAVEEPYTIEVISGGKPTMQRFGAAPAPAPAQ